MGRGPVGAPALVKYNDKSISEITEVGAAAKDVVVLIKTLTASSDSTLDFVNGSDDVVLDSTYPIYKFVFTSIHPQTDGETTYFQFNGSDDTSSHAYNISKTTTWFNAYHNEADTDTTLGYDANFDLANGTGFQTINPGMGGDADQCLSGELWLFNPSSTTFVTHFMAISNNSLFNNYQRPAYMAGYFNATAAITAIQFKMSSGNTDAGTIKMYGIKDS
tara:strand:- start:44 stop:700 length:657 start_codon:yes stop_codon:yes gene_type:complete